jgi:hypothetical protein
MTQSGIHVVQDLYRVALAGQEETIAQLVIPDMVWEILESFPHGGIYAGIPAIFGQFLPKLQADFHDWHAATGRVDRCWRHHSGSRPLLGDIENPWCTHRRAFLPHLDTQEREDRSPTTMCRHGHIRAGDAMVFRITSGTVGINECQRSDL